MTEPESTREVAGRNDGRPNTGTRPPSEQPEAQAKVAAKPTEAKVAAKPVEAENAAKQLKPDGR